MHCAGLKETRCMLQDQRKSDSLGLFETRHGVGSQIDGAGIEQKNTDDYYYTGQQKPDGLWLQKQEGLSLEKPDGL